MRTHAEQQFRLYYRQLADHWGPQHWWPAQTRFEVIVGAYLTQNTSWTNVEKALRQLRKARLLSLNGVQRTSLTKLESLIRSAGYFRQKAKRLKIFVKFLDKNYGGLLHRMFAEPTDKLREELLTLNGVGPETADSILLYAGQHPVFVVDAYTRRILERHGLLPANSTYEEIRNFCQQALAPIAAAEIVESWRTASVKSGAPGACHPPSRMSRARRGPAAQINNEMHGFLVGVGKNYCLKTKPKCDLCPLQTFLPTVK